TKQTIGNESVQIFRGEIWTDVEAVDCSCVLKPSLPCERGILGTPIILSVPCGVFLDDEIANTDHFERASTRLRVMTCSCRVCISRLSVKTNCGDYIKIFCREVGPNN